jgi:hypothetical protein
MQSGNVERQRTAQWPDIFYLHSAHTGYGCLGWHVKVTWPITWLLCPNFCMIALQWWIILVTNVLANSWRCSLFFLIYTSHTWAMLVLADMSSYIAHNLIIGPEFLHITMTNYIGHKCCSQFMMFQRCMLWRLQKFCHKTRANWWRPNEPTPNSWR